MAESEEQTKEETETANAAEVKESLDVHSEEVKKLKSSPNLSRKALDKIKKKRDDSDEKDPNKLLYTPWTFWYERSERGATAIDYLNNLKKLCTVETIAEFWGVMHNIPKVYELEERAGYHIMRHERMPSWEAHDNMNGGHWSMTCSKEKTEAVWQEMLLAAIGEQFIDCVEQGDSVCGVSVRIRTTDDVIQIWNDDSSLAEKSTIMQRVRELLHSFIPEIHERYQTHQDKLQTTRTVTRPSPVPPHHYGPPPYRPYPPQAHPFPAHHPGSNTYRYRPPSQYPFPSRPRPPY